MPSNFNDEPSFITHPTFNSDKNTVRFIGQYSYNQGLVNLNFSARMKEVSALPMPMMTFAPWDTYEASMNTSRLSNNVAKQIQTIDAAVK